MTVVAIFGDVHLGAERCLKKEFYDALESISEDMDIIIFNGDFLDAFDERGEKELNEFLTWGEEKKWKEKMIFITGGMGHEGNLLFDRPDIIVLPFAQLATIEGGRIIICHGHNIGLVKRKDETWREAARNLKEKLIKEKKGELSKIRKEDKIIISHTHAPFYDMENGIFATGTWKAKEQKEIEENSKRKMGVFIIYNDENRNDPIQMKRWMDKKKENG